MSSILDALRKLEQEKATREEVAAATPVRQLALEQDFDLDRDREPRSYTKAVVVSVVALLVLVSIGAGATAAVSIGLRRNEPIQQKVASAVPVSPPVPQPSQTTTTVQPVDVLDAPMESAAAETKPVKVVTAAPKETPAKKMEPAAPKAKTETTPAAKPAAAPVVVATNTKPATETPAEAAKPAEDEIDKLPILSESVRVRLGLPALKINIVGIPNTRNPRASTLINMQKVFQGETIPGTSARLMAVDLRGVVLDVNGQRYFLPRR